MVAGVTGDGEVGAKNPEGEPDRGEGAVVDVVGEVFGDPGQVVPEVGGAAVVGLDGREAEPVGLGQQPAEAGGDVLAVVVDPGFACGAGPGGGPPVTGVSAVGAPARRGGGP